MTVATKPISEELQAAFFLLLDVQNDGIDHKNLAPAMAAIERSLVSIQLMRCDAQAALDKL